MTKNKMFRRNIYRRLFRRNTGVQQSKNSQKQCCLIKDRLRPKGEERQQAKAEKKRLEQLAAAAASERIDELFQLYPKKTDPRNARLAIHRALGRATFDEIKAGLLKYVEVRRGEDPQYTKGTAAWFNADGWESDMERGGYVQRDSKMLRLMRAEDSPAEEPHVIPKRGEPGYVPY